MATQILKTTFQLKRGKSADWQKVNPVLRVGEPGFETDTGRLKIGDGSTEWNLLNYVGECGSGIINAETHFDFPSFGDANIIYKAEKEKKRKPVVNSYLVVSLGFLVLTIIFFVIYTCL